MTQISTKTYKGVEIIWSDVSTGDPPRHLYGLSGAVEKPAAVRPFLCSIREARDEINYRLELRLANAGGGTADERGVRAEHAAFYAAIARASHNPIGE